MEKKEKRSKAGIGLGRNANKGVEQAKRLGFGFGFDVRYGSKKQRLSLLAGFDWMVLLILNPFSDVLRCRTYDLVNMCIDAMHWPQAVGKRKKERLNVHSARVPTYHWSQKGRIRSKLGSTDAMCLGICAPYIQAHLSTNLNHIPTCAA